MAPVDDKNGAGLSYSACLLPPNEFKNKRSSSLDSLQSLSSHKSLNENPRTNMLAKSKDYCDHKLLIDEEAFQSRSQKSTIKNMCRWIKKSCLDNYGIYYFLAITSFITIFILFYPKPLTLSITELTRNEGGDGCGYIPLLFIIMNWRINFTIANDNFYPLFADKLHIKAHFNETEDILLGETTGYNIILSPKISNPLLFPLMVRYKAADFRDEAFYVLSKRCYFQDYIPITFSLTLSIPPFNIVGLKYKLLQRVKVKCPPVSYGIPKPIENVWWTIENTNVTLQ